MPISTLPTPPSRSDSPQDFSDRADALLGALPGFVTEANALQSDVNAKEASASSYATIATDKAAEAQASATTASTKASEAAASAVAAAAAASNAEIAFDSFDDKYLGSKASDPATDNDGNPLLTGALYWNTGVGAVRVWNGAAWLSMAADASIVDFQQAGTGAVVRTAQDKMREWVSVKDFGAVGDGAADDTAAIQAAIDAAVTQRKSLFFPRTSIGGLGLYRITSPLAISGNVRIFGDGHNYSGILCANCSGFQISAGVNFVTIEKLAIVQATRYSDTANSHRAIETLGTTQSRNFWHVYRDLFIDGFEWPLYLSYTWSTLINSVTSVYGFGGVCAVGLSVNNFISNCSFGGSKTAGSSGVLLGDGTVATEGWMIQDSLIESFATCIEGLGASNCHVRGCILDFFQQYGVLIRSSSTAGSLNWTVSENYMATDSASGSSGVRLLNSFSDSGTQNRGHVISNNQILKYSNAGLAYGINVDGTAERGCVITGNRIDATTYACSIAVGTDAIVSNNWWKGGAFKSDVSGISYANNRGSVATTAGFTAPRGSFTPVVFGTTTAGDGTYTAQSGYYKIVDGVCHFTLRVAWTAHTGTGNMRISGLPRASLNSLNLTPALAVFVENLTFPAGASSVVGFIQQGSSIIELRGAGSGLAPTPVAMDSAATLIISGSYEV